MNPPSSTKQITVEEVSQAQLENKNMVLLDVRTEGEFLRGHIAKSINVPIDEIETKIAGIIPNKDQLIYAYCLSGSRSDIVVNFLTQNGYTNAYSVQSGLLAWRSKKYELIV